ncbi:2-C-methyl-D-erythritol 4-phosphate cytidylyltransferase [Natronogracilivirga saccharolytica]|uniref:2-C-methyl-D-erythritol 4-phosphate cytidylyltransferase n=1 Tax=Natronogracilivirga saccharolytica TaxID=2812953 RepID=A0A8J7RSA9_9BACT|nr:2-C-methyl-D-erythritol 4-phosphate cytidylyltransferase [Natronogracilivirga saccharolytica]MBP3192027.1 2-C-methyl-D-erythritol 4-phosphate cytidylyltransferase [Natronogracilivirga saccharolytica]
MAKMNPEKSNKDAGVIIPSAGTGVRMGGGTPKQFLEINGMPLLAHTIRRILKISCLRKVVIPSSPDLSERTRDIAHEGLESSGLSGSVDIAVVAGGDERMDSVRNGLHALKDDDITMILVHDAVRPCFPLDAVEQAIDEARTSGAAIIAVPARDTVKMVDGNNVITSTPDRERVWLAQTPQVFRKELFVRAYDKLGDKAYLATDDASVVEQAGYPVRVVHGTHDNIKVTYRPDLQFAGIWLKANGEA